MSLSATATLLYADRNKKLPVPVLHVKGAVGLDPDLALEASRIGWWVNELLTISSVPRRVVVDLLGLSGAVGGLRLRPSGLLPGITRMALVVRSEFEEDLRASNPGTSVVTTVAEAVRAVSDYEVTGRSTPIQWPEKSVEVQVGAWRAPPDGAVAAWVSVKGTYPPGSAGADDAAWIGWAIDEIVERLDPVALVVDVRDLSYVWGDDLRLEPTERPLKLRLLRVLARPEAREALRFAVADEVLAGDEAEVLSALESAGAMPGAMPGARLI